MKNKNLIRLFAFIIVMSPWIYLGSTLKDVLAIVCGVVIILATVDISKKKKEESVI